jgi:hypothetical protein
VGCFRTFTFHKMNELERRELLQLLKQASTALAETQAELKEAKKVVAEWRKLKSDEDWDNVTSSYKRKTVEQWEQEVDQLKEQKKLDEKREELARAAFVAVVPKQGITIAAPLPVKVLQNLICCYMIRSRRNPALLNQSVLREPTIHMHKRTSLTSNHSNQRHIQTSKLRNSFVS